MTLKSDEEIRMLTIRNPYAELVLHGKQIETRTRITNYRGLVLIHTGLVDFPWDEVETLAGDKYFNKILDMFDNKTIAGGTPGKAIALARLVDCRPMNKSDEPLAFVSHSHALYSWIFKDIIPIVPFKIKGSQGMNRITPEARKLIKLT